MADVVVSSDRARPTLSKDRLFAIVGSVAIVAISLLLNQRAGTVSDVSWNIHIIERLWSGQRLYIDIMEANPPFTVWLYWPAVWMADRLSIAPEIAILAYTYATVFIGFALTATIVRRGGLLAAEARWWLWPALLAILLILPVGAFSQREHIGLALFLPLLAVMAWRRRDTGENRPPLTLAVLAGLAGSVMIVVKPHWALAIALPALWTAISRRSFAALVNIEFVIIGTVATIYLLVVLAIHPEFLDTLFPLLKLVYLPIRAESSDWLPIAIIFTVSLSVWILCRSRGPVSPLADVAAIAAIGFFIAMVVLGKGWYYHRYPAQATALIASILALEQLIRQGGGSAVYRIGCVVLALVAFARPLYDWSTREGKADAALVADIRGQTNNPSVVIVGSDIGLTFPLLRQIDGRMSAPFCSDWVPAHALHRLSQDELAADGLEAEQLRAVFDDYVENKLAAMRAERPDLIIEAKSGSSLDYHWVRHLQAMPAYKTILANYEPLTENRHIAVWQRKARAAIEPFGLRGSLDAVNPVW